ncbi:hypothetical protein [uncultured Microbacterium sp.]|uniref:hypothetical protein n=1 Tax=uncultured Microbacterium sp. TaxID=191216 RepID=UPI0025F1E9B1|nr:hypothetical protein [uncultured Microbacterium sp.]
MEVEELLARAWGAVEKAGIPQPLQEYAFKEALARLGGQASLPTPSPKAQHAASSDAPRDTGEIAPRASAGDLSDPFSKFSHESGISVEDLERVFYFSEDGLPHINVPRSKLGRTSTEQQKVVAVAITAAYDYVRDERPISEDVARAEATRLKVDLANWARTMGGVQGIGWTGAARQKQFKANGSTPEALKKVVAAILGAPAE